MDRATGESKATATKGQFALAILTIVLISTAVPLAGFLLPGLPPPTDTGLLLALVLLVGTIVKFAIADALTEDGFNIEKTATDFALALATALLSLAAKQTIDKQPDEFVGATLLVRQAVGDLWPHDPLTNARAALWLLAGVGYAMAIASFLLALGAARRKRTAHGAGGWANASRAASVLCGTTCYALYYATTLFKD